MVAALGVMISFSASKSSYSILGLGVGEGGLGEPKTLEQERLEDPCH